MADAVTVSTADLRAALNMLLDVAAARFGPDVTLGADLYWNLDLAAAFDMHQAPEAAVDVGSLADDITSIHEMLDRGSENVVLWHDLAHALGILRRIAAMDLA